MNGWVRALIQALLVLGTLFFVNCILDDYYHRFDLTKNQMYTLSNPTKNLVRDLPDQCIIQYFVSKKLPNGYVAPAKQIEDTLEEFESSAQGRIRLEILRMADEDEEIKDIASRLGIAAKSDQTISETELSFRTFYSGISVRMGAKQETLPFISSLESLEYDLATRIKLVSVKERKKVGFLTGHGEPSIYSNPYQGAGPLVEFANMVGLQFITEAVDLDEGRKPISDDIETLIVIQGEQELNEREVYLLDQHLMKGKKLLFMIWPNTLAGRGQQVMAKFASIPLFEALKHYGVEVNKDIVTDRSNLIKDNPVFVFSTSSENLNEKEPIMRRLKSLGFIAPSSLTIRDDLKDVRGIALVQSTQYAKKLLPGGMRGAASYDLSQCDLRENPDYFAGEREKLTLIALLDGKFTSYWADKKAPGIPAPKRAEGGEEAPKEIPDANPVLGFSPQSQIVVIAEPNFALVEGNQFQNKILLLNAIDVLTTGGEFSDIRAREGGIITLKADISPGKKKWIKHLGAFLMPLLMTIAGIAFFFVRRAAKNSFIADRQEYYRDLKKNNADEKSRESDLDKEETVKIRPDDTTSNNGGAS